MPVIKINHGEFADISAQILTTGSLIKFQAGGFSMWPFIRDGDVLWVVPISDEARRYDVLLFSTGAGLLRAHRVVGVKKERGKAPRYLMQGDALPWPDGWIDRENVIGRITRVERCGTSLDVDGLFRIAAAVWHIIAAPLIRVGWFFMRIFRF